MVQLGVYVGNNPADVANFEAWLGRPVDLVAANTGERSWADMDPEWQFRDVFLGGADRPMLWSIPLFPQTSSLVEVAAGAGDAHFTAFAKTILANATPSADGNIYVRTGWEVGGDMFAWSAQAKENPEAFRQAFARFADAFHGVSDKFKVVWDAVGDRGNVTQFYPGDEYVDVVSQDFYWQPQWSSYDPAEAFEYYAGSSQGQGLNELKAFADAHGKPFAVSEWGVKEGYDATGFIEAAKAWFEANDVLWATYWDSDAAYPGKLSDGTDATSGAAFKSAFGPDAEPSSKPVPTPTPASTPVEAEAGSGPDSLVLKVSQDAYQGSAQYTVSVDGVQVGETFTASASHAAGQSDTLTVKGDWGPGDHKVEVRFLNDAWGGTAATDRNLYVDSATYNGQAVAGAAQSVLSDAQPGAFSFTEEAAAAPSTPAPAALTAGTGTDSLVLKVSQDAYQGSAQYTVSVDGEQVGGTFTASALHGSGQSDTLTLKGDWGAGDHKVEVRFLNDAWGGTAATDRNLHIDSAAYNGEAVQGAAQAVEVDWQPGAFSFTEAAAPAPTPAGPTTQAAGSGPDALVLKVSQDAYQGSAQYTVKVDGVQVGGTFTASASHAAGQSDTLTLKGDWAAGEHKVEVAFLNDAWGGTAATDRNLYVDSAAYNGQAVAGAAKALMAAGAQGFAFIEAAPAPAPAAETGTDGADLFDATAAGGVFTGKGGRDLFVFEEGDGQVTVTDFASRQDKLVFVDLDRADVTTEAAAAGPPGLNVHYGDGGTVFLAGVAALAERDMVFA